jgi:hypothetical protein
VAVGVFSCIRGSILKKTAVEKRSDGKRLFLGAFAKLRKGTIKRHHVCLSVSVCLSVRMEQLGSQWMDFDET